MGTGGLSPLTLTTDEASVVKVRGGGSLEHHATGQTSSIDSSVYQI